MPLPAPPREQNVAPVIPIPGRGSICTPSTVPSVSSLQLLMESARRVWGKQAVEPPAANVTPMPPPAPKDAFAALMQAAANPVQVAQSGRAKGNGGKDGSGGKTGGGKGGGQKTRIGWGRGRGGRLPPYKYVEGTRFVVDGFTCGVTPGDVHFLTHFHADHYVGLSKKWTAPIYASAITAALVTRRLGIAAHMLVTLPMDTPTEIDGALVTCIDANHCPGAVLLLFELRDGRCVLHTGDFRYEPSTMALHPAVRRVLSSGQGLDALYLDTTYLKPAYRFPTQAAAVRHVVDTCRLLQPNQRTLVLFGSYSIGKERVFLQVSRELGVPIHVERQKMRLLECMSLPTDDQARLFTLGPDGRGTGSGLGGVPGGAGLARWRVVPMGHLRAPKLRALLAASRASFDAIVAFRPSGWCFNGGSGGSGGAAGRTVRLGKDLTIVEVPYSEHSSFDELRMCVRDLRPRKIVATVDGGPQGLTHPGMPLLRG